MNSSRNSRHVVWHRSSELQMIEWCTLTEGPDEIIVEGLVLGAVAGLPWRTEYRVLCDSGWHTCGVDVRQQHGSRTAELALARDATGDWARGRSPDPGLQGCTDVDLGFSPSTNTLPIRRLALATGKSETISAAWVLFPDLRVCAALQSYTRLSDQRYRFASDGFSAELSVDTAGMVIDYWEWQRIAEMAYPP
jgi:uncharacterized protein